METPTGHPGPHLYTLPDLRRCLGRSVYTDRQDPFANVGARSGSDTAAVCVAISDDIARRNRLGTPECLWHTRLPRRTQACIYDARSNHVHYT